VAVEAVVEAVDVDEQRLSTAFHTLSVHEARALLLYGIERRRPVQLVVGRAGSGKSRLLGALSRTAIEGADLVLVRTLPASLEDTAALLAQHFTVPDVRGESPIERLTRVAAVLAERRRAGRLVALLVDDAHLLSMDSLLDLRLFAGTDAEGGALLPIVIAGRPELAATLEEPRLDTLRRGIATHVELRRPLPAAIDEAETVPDPVAMPEKPPRRTRWRLLASLASLAILVAAAATVLTLEPPVPRIAPLAQPEGPPAPPAAVRPAPAPALAPPPTNVPATPEDDVRLAPGGRLTADRVRAVVADLGVALASRNLARLQHLLARDARQNGVRGRDAILESYAYRFTRLDSPISIGAPKRITLRGKSALAEVPFDTAYRDAGGNVGTVSGTLRARIDHHKGRLVVDALDWAFDSDRP
jgi:hypothetical protein